MATFIMSPRGLRWRKLDLHVHTPASKDYSGNRDITPDEFVTTVISKGVDAIAITDHNTGEWIDRLKQAANGRSLAVFPGVEISVGGGERGVHIIAVFDCSATTKDVENLLARLGFSAKEYGDLHAVAHGSVEDVIEAIHTAGGLAILAHADSAKGVLHDMKGQQRTDVMNSPRLAAVELTNVAKSSRFCGGTDQEFKQKLAYYRSSDNRTPGTDDGHSVDGVGSRYSWFKTDGLSLDALKQAFTDPDVRIRCDVESPDIPRGQYPRVLRLTVSQGFLKGSFDFHEGLNSIIGGKGVGKSVLIELLRFALTQPSIVADIVKDMNGKLTDQLKLGGKVIVRVQLESEEIVDVSRTFDGAGNPVKAVFVDGGAPLQGDIAKLFPVLAYSQTETVLIAKDNNAQLALIDTFLDLASIESRIATLERELDKSDMGIADALEAETRHGDAERALATHNAQIAGLEKALKSKELDALTVLKPKSDFMRSVEGFAEELEEAVEGVSRALAAVKAPKVPAALANDQDADRLAAALAVDAKKLVGEAKRLEASVAMLVKKGRDASTAWEKFVLAKEKDYDKFVEKQGGDRKELNARKNALVAQRPALADTVARIKKTIGGLPALWMKRATLLAQLDAEEDKRHEMRKAKYAELTRASDGKLQVELDRDAERTGYVAALIDLKRGSRVQDITVEQVCATVAPRRLLDMVEKEDVAGLKTASGVSEASAKSLLVWLKESGNARAKLALAHGQRLRDRPAIKFRKEDGKYYELSQLSVGQKCTALLIIALSDGTRPIIIDQPEDALDITSVYTDVTLQLRGRKHARQFILTTHNPTVAVAADSDQFHVLRADATQAELSIDGAIDLERVREAVIQHLEGGRVPFALKSRKYGLGNS